MRKCDSMRVFKEFIEFIRSDTMYGTSGTIPLHAPVFHGNEKKYLNECIDSTFVSSVGHFVENFEQGCSAVAGVRNAIAAVNGTAALHIALLLAGAGAGNEVITQPLTFIATANAISYTGASPVFLDIDEDTMGLSPVAVRNFLRRYGKVEKDGCIDERTGHAIKACIPMHTFGFPCRIMELRELCDEFSIHLIEDAAESIGSYYKGKHTGSFGLMGILSFNGNKTITCGGGGMILTDNKELALKAKHMTTTARLPHRWEISHDSIGYNYRLTNVNAAIGCAQLERLAEILAEKRDIARLYAEFWGGTRFRFVLEPPESTANYWLNSVLFPSRETRDEFLSITNNSGIMTRPAWKLLPHLDMYKGCHCERLDVAIDIENRLVNLPSGVRGFHV